MRINSAGLALLKRFEGCSLEAYPDPGTGDEPWTIGYGHTGDNIHPGTTITQEQADDLLIQDLAKFERGVEQYTLTSLNENQFSALVVFVYNVGLHNYTTSTLLKKLTLEISMELLSSLLGGIVPMMR